MNPKKSNVEYLRIFSCPEGCKKKPFDSVMALNVHLANYHDAKYRIDLSRKGRAYARMIISVTPLLSD